MEGPMKYSSLFSRVFQTKGEIQSANEDFNFGFILGGVVTPSNAIL